MKNLLNGILILSFLVLQTNVGYALSTQNQPKDVITVEYDGMGADVDKNGNINLHLDFHNPLTGESYRIMQESISPQLWETLKEILLKGTCYEIICFILYGNLFYIDSVTAVPCPDDDGG